MLKVSYIVNSVFTSRTYILSDGDKQEFWLVDCGDVPPILERLSSLGGDLSLLKGVLLTHVHYDHIYGLPRLTELHPDIKVFTNDFGVRALTDDRLNYSKYHNDPIRFTSDNVVVCKEGTKIHLFDDVNAKVFETPGHNPSCLTFAVEDYLFTGDAYIPGLKVVTLFVGANKKQAVESENRIEQMSVGKIICPGHEVSK